MNTRIKHTRGPWSVHYNNEGLTVFSPNNVTVAYVDFDECEERPVEANAHLIAAAPAMYEALKASLLAIPDGMTSNTSPICQQIRAALAQAEGKTL